MLQWALANGYTLDSEMCNLYGKIPLYIAIENSHEALTRALIMGAADVRAENDLDLEEAAENDSWTPLCIAAHKGHEAMVRALIDADADVNK